MPRDSKIDDRYQTEKQSDFLSVAQFFWRREKTKKVLRTFQAVQYFLVGLFHQTLNVP